MKQQMSERNTSICAYYESGQNLASCEKKFRLKRQRVRQILKKAGIWRAHEKSQRTQFLGVTVNKSTKVALKRMADEEGLSVSKLASDALDELVK